MEKVVQLCRDELKHWCRKNDLLLVKEGGKESL